MLEQTSVQTGKLSRFWQLFKQSLKGGEHDYTQGGIRSAIVLLAIPMILELSLESVFALVDIFFVGRLGKEAITTVGLTESVITIVYSVAIGLSTAATATVARRVGEKNNDAAAQAGVQSLIISLAVTVFLSIIGIIFAPQILEMMGAEASVVKNGAIFTRIMLGGSGVIMLLFLINGIFRGAGNAAIAMRSLWLASFLNIVLCPLFIYGFNWGLPGAAIATTIGRGVGVLYQCYYLFRGNSVVRILPKHLKVDMPLIRSMLRIAWPATFQFLIASGSWIVLARLVAVTGGTEASAGYQIAIRNIVFFILPAWGLSNAAATLVGQNLGAGQPERAEQSVLLAVKYNIIFMGLVMLLFLFCSPWIIQFFTKGALERYYGALSLQIIGAGYIFYGIGMVMMQAINGAGDTRTPTIINFAGFWLFQIPFAYFLAKGLNMGPKGAFIAVPVAEVLIAIAAYIVFKRGKWKTVKV